MKRAPSIVMSLTLLGTATLLQSLAVHGGKVALRRMSLLDEPKADFRGLMIDVVRKYHTIEGLKEMVELCRLYKVRYLQLHLTDDQAFTFPSRQTAGTWEAARASNLQASVHLPLFGTGGVSWCGA